MGRFIIGLILGALAGFIAWYFSGSVPLTVFVGSLVALIVWFTKAADDILDFALEFGRSIVGALGKILD